MVLNSKQIELYLAAARTENLTWAAEKSFVSKATMSRQLAALEEELGYRLFYHRGNSIRLTPEGEILKDTLEKMQFLMHKGLQEMEDVHRGRRGHLVMGFTSDTFIPDVYLREIDTFRRKYPDIRVSYVSKPFTDYFNDLESGAIDIVLSHDISLMKYKTLEHLPVAEARRKLYYGIRHPLARKKDLSIRDFAENIHWASVHADTPEQRDSLKQITDYYDMPQFQTEYVATTHDIIFHLLLGEGFSIMDDFVLQNKPNDIRILPVSEELPLIRLSVFWCRDHGNPCIPLFCDVVRQSQKDSSEVWAVKNKS